MIKFALIIWVCSFVGNPGACLPPLEYPKQFDSWYECARTAHQESRKILASMGYKMVNESKIAMKYSCKAIETT